MPYRFSLPRARQTRPDSAPAIPMEAPPEEQVGLVVDLNGVARVPDSKEEYWVSLALRRLQLPFYYQFRIGGGKDIRGGVVVDFVYMSPAGWRPLQVHGAAWHKGDERLNDVLIAAYFKITTDEVAQRTVWDYEIPTLAQTYPVVRRKTQ